MDVETTANIVIGCAIRIHKALGPGLIETAYESLLEARLTSLGMKVERQKPIDLVFEELVVPAAYKIDLLVNDELVLELKATEKHSPVFSRQLMTYMKISGKSLGLLINFGQETLVQGLQRVVCGHPTSPFIAPSRDKIRC
jgi:iron complex transport system substrate-binding protein